MTSTQPGLSPHLSDALHRISDQGLSSVARVAHVALLLVALGMGIVIAALLATEPALPRRTVVAFTVMLLIAASWIAYAIWVLRHRHTLMAQHRVVAGRMAVVFCTMFSAAALAAGVIAQSAAGLLAAATGVVMLIAALVLLRRATRTLRELFRRRAQIETEIGRG
jgi:hypothetical protein